MTRQLRYSLKGLSYFIFALCFRRIWEIAEGLEVPGCSYINKPTFGWTHWSERNFEEIELCGLCTDICVVSNALILKAEFPDVELTVDATCCAGVTPESHEAALTTMKMCQIHVIGE